MNCHITVSWRWIISSRLLNDKPSQQKRLKAFVVLSLSNLDSFLKHSMCIPTHTLLAWRLTHWPCKQTKWLTHIQDKEVIVAERSIPATKHHQLVVDQCCRVAVTFQKTKVWLLNEWHSISSKGAFGVCSWFLEFNVPSAEQGYLRVIQICNCD